MNKSNILKLALLLCATACCIVKGTLLAFIGPEAPSNGSQRTLTFAERVAYQRAIEDVYWRHRIWPKDQRDPKPSLDAVISQARIERKVAEYLRNSQALANYWQRPITAGQLQAEMERMAQHTRQPEVLRELFEALGEDPFVIAECLARPALAERMLAHPTVQQVRQTSRSYSQVVAGTADYTLPTISDGLNGCIDNTWTPTSTINAPEPREGPTAVWTGSEMIVWGGAYIAYSPLGGAVGLNTGGRYNPSTDSWTPTSTTNAPAGRFSHTAVWTGTEMIVWGGEPDLHSSLNTGGRYSPITDSWTATTTNNAPSARWWHTAIWTDSEMIIWGGVGDPPNAGGRYNPITDSWTATSTTNAPSGRSAHTAVWTGSEMIIWGGWAGVGIYFNTGGRYNPTTDSWIATSIANAPTARYYHTAVWTRNEMIVWGGANESTEFNTGGRYDPDADSWVATRSTDAPSSREGHSAVWTGSEMIVWGGVEGCHLSCWYFNSGGQIQSHDG